VLVGRRDMCVVGAAHAYPQTGGWIRDCPIYRFALAPP